MSLNKNNILYLLLITLGLCSAIEIEGAWPPGPWRKQCSAWGWNCAGPSGTPGCQLTCLIKGNIATSPFYTGEITQAMEVTYCPNEGVWAIVPVKGGDSQWCN